MSGLELRSNPDIYICQGARGIDIYVRGAYLCCVKFRVGTSVRVSLKVFYSTSIYVRAHCLVSGLVRIIEECIIEIVLRPLVLGLVLG